MQGLSCFYITTCRGLGSSVYPASWTEERMPWSQGKQNLVLWKELQGMCYPTSVRGATHTVQIGQKRMCRMLRVLPGLIILAPPFWRSTWKKLSILWAALLMVIYGNLWGFSKCLQPRHTCHGDAMQHIWELEACRFHGATSCLLGEPRLAKEYWKPRRYISLTWTSSRIGINQGWPRCLKRQCATNYQFLGFEQ